MSIIKSNTNNEDNLSIFVENFEREKNNKLLSYNEFYYSDTDFTNFELTLKENQVLWIKDVEGLTDDPTLSLQATFRLCNGSTFEYRSDLVLIKPNGDEFYKGFNSLKDIAVIGIYNVSNVRQGRIIGYVLDFEKPILDQNTDPINVVSVTTVFQNILAVNFDNTPPPNLQPNTDANIKLNVYEEDGITLIASWDSSDIGTSLAVLDNTVQFNANNAVIFPADIVVEIDESFVLIQDLDNDRKSVAATIPYTL